MCRSATYDLLLTFHSNHEPISYRFRDKRRFQSKIAKIFPPRVFCAHAQGVSLRIGYWRSATKKLELWGYRVEKEFDDIINHLDILHRARQTDRRTDGRTPATAKTALTHSVARQKLIVVVSVSLCCILVASVLQYSKPAMGEHPLLPVCL